MFDLDAKNVTATSCGAPVRDSRDQYNTISITLGVLSGFFMLLRIFTKLVILKTELGADDWTIIATVLSGIPSSVLNIHGLTASKQFSVFCSAHSSISLSFTLHCSLLPAFWPRRLRNVLPGHPCLRIR